MKSKKILTIEHAIFDETLYLINGQQVSYETGSRLIVRQEEENDKIVGRAQEMYIPRTPRLTSDTSATLTDTYMDDVGTETETHRAISNGENVKIISSYEVDDENRNHVPAESRYPLLELRAPKCFEINALIRAKYIDEPSRGEALRGEEPGKWKMRLTKM